MKTKIILLIAFLSCINAYAQVEKDDVIFSAMEDEMKRSLDSLTYKDHPKPFFISYLLFDTDYLNIDSEIGALSASDQDFMRSSSLRLMIGNYSLNDENYENWDYSGGDYSPWDNPSFPINSDYSGMRKAWWLETDAIYRRAISSYEKKIKTIEEQKLEGNELLLPDYSKQDSLTLIIEREEYPFNKEILERKMTELSAACLTFPEIIFTKTHLYVNKSTVYHFNSEHIKFKLPLDETSFSLSLSIEDTNQRTYTSQMSIVCRNPLLLPDNEVILQDAKKLAAFLIEKTNAPVMEEDYMGPVLFVGNIASQILCSSLIGGEESLIAERQSLVANSTNVYFTPIDNRLQRKWKKKALPENISISVYPTLRSYKGVELLGTSYIDYEGVIPPDTLNLIENGILVGMLADRIPTNVTNRSNGLYRISANSYSVSASHEPGVVKFSSNKVIPEADMKSHFIEYASKNGYEFAYIIKTIPGEVAEMPNAIYKVNTKTGEEEMVRNCSYKTSLEIRDFKDIVDYSDQVSIFNGSPTSSSYNEYNYDAYYSYGGGSTVSYIAPNSFIIDEFTIDRIDEINNLQKNIEYLPNPIKEYKKQLGE